MKHLSQTLNHTLVPFFAAALMSAGLFSGQTAQALVEPDGSFAPVQCGLPNEASTIHEICVGRIVGGQGTPAVQFRFENQTSRVFRVDHVQNLILGLESGNQAQILFLVGPDGEQASMRVSKTPDDYVATAVGRLGESQYKIPQFERVFTLQ